MTGPRRPAARRWADRLLTALFAAGIAAVPARTWLGDAPATTANEFRAPTEMPPLTPATAKFFPDQFELYFKDRMGFRGPMIQLNRRARVEALGVSIHPSVALGEMGWVYFDPPNDFRDARAGERLPGHLRAWADALRRRGEWLAARGIRYVFAFAPEKQSVYPEHLPPRYLARPLTAAQDRLLGLAPGEHVLDLRPALRLAKARRVVYYANDTHWNEAGGYVAAAAILRRLGLSPRPESDYRVETKPSWHGDLDRMLARPADWPGPAYPVYSLDRPAAAVTVAPTFEGTDLAHQPRVGFAAPSAGEPRAMLLHDSFGVALQRFLPESFARLDCLPTRGFPAAAVEAAGPEVVIQVLAERNLLLPVEDPAP